MGKTIKYSDRSVYVSDEVADFLETDRKRQESEARSDRRHFSKYPTVKHKDLSSGFPCSALERDFLRKVRLSELQNAIDTLDRAGRKLLKLYYIDDLSMEEVGLQLGISKVAVSKRHRKLIAKLRNLMDA